MMRTGEEVRVSTPIIAGGIVSAGVDGERCAEAVANYLNQSSEQ